VAWLPDGATFVSAGVDKALLLWSVATGAVLQAWHGARLHHLAINQSGTQLIAACEMGIRVCPIEHMSADTPTLTVPDELWIVEDEPITSLSLSRDGRHALVNTASQEIHLWELTHKVLAQRYSGHKQGRFVIRAAFGGADESFVLCGSEDSQVYVWHRHSATPIEMLPGHSGAVNAVAWSPAHAMFASASDDHTVRVWGGSHEPAVLQ
jgi:WD40 repeat protein